MSSFLPAALALLGVGMFALSVWVQESGKYAVLEVPAQSLPVWQEPAEVPRPDPAPEAGALPVSADLVP